VSGAAINGRGESSPQPSAAGWRDRGRAGAGRPRAAASADISRPGPDPALARPWGLALGGLIALAAAVGIGRFAYTPILPAMAAGLGLTQAQAGLVASLNVAGYLVGALAGSAPRLPGSRRAWLMGALAASAVTTFLMAIADGMAALLLLRFGGGAASAFALVFASSLVLDRLVQAGRPGLSAVHFAGVGAGIALSAILVAALSAAGVGWRGLWAGSGLIALAALPAVAALVPPEKDLADTPEAGGGGPGLGRPLALVSAAYFLFGVGYIVTATFLVALVSGEPALRRVEPAVWLVVGLAAVPSVALWSTLARRIGTLPAFALALLVQAGGVAASTAATSEAGVLLSAALLGGTFMGVTALGIAGARSLAPSDPRRAVALMTAAFGLGSAIAPPVAGLIADGTGSFALSTYLAALALVGAAALALAARRA